MKINDIEEARALVVILRSLDAIDPKGTLALRLTAGGDVQCNISGHPHSKDTGLRENHAVLKEVYARLRIDVVNRLQRLGVEV